MQFSIKKLEEFIRNENKFISNLIFISGLPDRSRADELDDGVLEPTKTAFIANVDKKSRAKSLSELEERLKAITTKKKLTYKEKLAKKGLKNRLKKKNKQDVRKNTQKLERAAKLALKKEPSDQSANSESKKPVFNKDNKIVFSKIDFANLGKKKNNKQDKDPEKILQKLNEENSKLQQLEQSGEIEKVLQIKEKTAWKNALAKAEGQKIKDDPILLKKSVQKSEQKVRSSKKKWEARIEKVEKTKDDRQKKRTENIQKRKKEKKIKKLKSSAKRGKIIPGF